LFGPQAVLYSLENGKAVLVAAPKIKGFYLLKDIPFEVRVRNPI
jgi:hypothetical protein